MHLRRGNLLPRNPVINATARTFTTSTRLALKPRTRISDLFPRGTDLRAEIPLYPYGPNRLYKQSNSGLYGGARIRYGNNVSKDSETKTRRHWKPNVHHHNLFSSALNRPVRLRATTRVLRTIDKVGGLDNYLLGNSHSRIKQLGVTGWALRWAVLKSPGGRKRSRNERDALGLPGIIEEPGRVNAMLDTPEMRERFIKMRYDYGLKLPRPYQSPDTAGSKRRVNVSFESEGMEASFDLDRMRELANKSPSLRLRSLQEGFPREVEAEKPSISERFLRAIRLRR